MVLCVGAVAACGRPPLPAGPPPLPAALPGAFQGVRASSGARLEVIDAGPVDFGTVWHAAGVQKRCVRFRNAGTDPLVIARVTHSCCGCIQGRAADPVVKPGAQSEIELVLDPAKRKGNLNIRVTIEAHAAGAIPPIVATAKVVDDIEPVPAVVDFSRGDVQTVTFVNHAARADFAIEAMAQSLPFIVVEAVEPAGRDVRVRLRCLSRDSFVGCVRFGTTLAGWPELTVGVARDATAPERRP